MGATTESGKLIYSGLLSTESKRKPVVRLTLGVVELSTSRSVLPFLVGWLCLIFAVVLFVFSALMLLLQTPPLTCLVIGSTALFPALIAVACLLPSKRTIALRVIGGIVFAACVGTFITTFVNPVNDGQGRSRRGLLVVAAIAGGAMAIKGKWPGSNGRVEPVKEPSNAQDALGRAD